MGNEADIYLLRNKWLEETVKKLQKTEHQVTVHGWHDLLHLLTHKLNGRLEIESEEIGWKSKVRGYTHVKHAG